MANPDAQKVSQKCKWGVRYIFVWNSLFRLILRFQELQLYFSAIVLYSNPLKHINLIRLQIAAYERAFSGSDGMRN